MSDVKLYTRRDLVRMATIGIAGTAIAPALEGAAGAVSPRSRSLITARSLTMGGASSKNPYVTDGLIDMYTVDGWDGTRLNSLNGKLPPLVSDGIFHVTGGSLVCTGDGRLVSTVATEFVNAYTGYIDESTPFEIQAAYDCRGISGLTSARSAFLRIATDDNKTNAQWCSFAGGFSTIDSSAQRCYPFLSTSIVGGNVVPGSYVQYGHRKCSLRYKFQSDNNVALDSVMSGIAKYSVYSHVSETQRSSLKGSTIRNRFINGSYIDIRLVNGMALTRLAIYNKVLTDENADANAVADFNAMGDGQ